MKDPRLVPCTAGTQQTIDPRLHIATSTMNIHSAPLSQAVLNRLALKHVDTGNLPLKAENLELLARQQHELEQANQHGGSAALLHSSRSQSGREALRSTAVREMHTTEAFRPSRADDDNLFLIEVEEEEDEPRDKRKEKIVVERQRHERQRGRDERSKERRVRGPEAVEVAKYGDRRLYRIT